MTTLQRAAIPRGPSDDLSIRSNAWPRGGARREGEGYALDGASLARVPCLSALRLRQA